MKLLSLRKPLAQRRLAGRWTRGFLTVPMGRRALCGLEGVVIQQDRGGWIMPAGRGWVFYFQPGHFARDLEIASYLQMLVNAIRWEPADR
jgi:hypothetical protein